MVGLMSTENIAEPASEVAHAERVHHPFSPSKLNDLEACPRFRQGDSTNEASQRGTAQHEATETGNDADLSDEEHEAVEKAREFVRGIESGIVEETGQPPVRVQEEYLPIDDIGSVTLPDGTPEATSAGYLDLALLEHTLTAGHIIDYKFGKHAVVPAHNNLQGFAYALGLRKKYPTIKSLWVHFVMPYRDEVLSCRLDFSADSDAVHIVWQDDSGEWGSREENIYLRIQTVVARAMSATSKASPNAKTCTFCMDSVKADCEPLHQFALRVADKYEPLSVPDVINPSLVSVATPDDIGRGLKFFSILEGLSKAYRGEAAKRAMTEDDFHIPGYRVQTSSSRELVNKIKFVEVAREFGLTDEDLLECSDILFGATEKRVSKNAERGQKGATTERFKARLAEVGATAESSPSISLRMAA
jgi:hypothetical protein